MFAPHPPTRITDLLNPVRPPERAPSSPASSPYSEDGRERGRIDRGEHGSPSLRSHAGYNGYSRHQAPSFTERLEDECHHRANNRDDDMGSRNSLDRSPGSPYTQHGQQRTQQHPYSLRAASWDTATTYGERRANGHGPDDFDDRAESGGMMNVTWSIHHSQTSMRLPSIDREGT